MSRLCKRVQQIRMTFNYKVIGVIVERHAQKSSTEDDDWKVNCAAVRKLCSGIELLHFVICNSQRISLLAHASFLRFS